MRPGPIRPGDVGWRTAMVQGSTRFNEARADSPGRSRAQARERYGERASMRARGRFAREILEVLQLLRA